MRHPARATLLDAFTRAARSLRLVRMFDGQRRTSPAGRWLAARGQHAFALAIAPSDPVVLSSLGLHQSALSLLDAPRDRAEMIAAVRSSVGLGRSGDAASIAGDTLRRWPESRSQLVDALLGLGLDALEFMDGDDWRRAAVLLSMDRPELALDLAKRCHGLDAQPELVAAIYRRLGRHTDADLSLAELCRREGVRPVQFRHPHTGVAALHCAEGPKESGELVSVVMPCWNVASTLSVALRSVLNQDYRNIEVIVVDDFSGDATASVALDLADQDSRVRVLRLSRRHGAYGARNAGIGMARGVFLTFHDGDDWSHPQKIALQVQALREAPHAVGSVSNWIRMLDDGSFTARQVLPLSRLNMSSLLVRRPIAAARAGNFDNVTAGADSEYLARLRLIFGTSALKRVPKVLSFASCRPDSLMHAASTGYGSTPGTQRRVAYWEAWNRWHAEVFRSNAMERLRVGTDRPFPLPDVDLQDRGTTSPAPMGLPR